MLVDLVISNFVMVGLLVLLSAAMGPILFQPLQAARSMFRVRPRFHLADLVLVSLQLQLMLAAILWWTGDLPILMRILPAIDAGLMVVIWWLSGLVMAARAGIERSADRWLFIGLLVPVGHVALLFNVVGIPLSLAMLLFGVESIVSGQLLRAGQQCSLLLAGLLPLATCIAIRFACHRLVRRAKEFRSQLDGVLFLPHTNPPSPLSAEEPSR